MTGPRTMNEPIAMLETPNATSEPTSQSRDRTSFQPWASSDRNDARTMSLATRSMRSRARVTMEPR